MKNWLLTVISMGFLFACSGKEEQTVASAPEETVSQEQPQVQQDFPLCTINGHDCLEILELLKETEPVYSTAPETEMYSPDVAGFKNPALAAKGFSVGYYSSHNDGGPSIASIFWGESDWVNINILYDNDTPNILHLSFSNGTRQQYDLPKKHIK